MRRAFPRLIVALLALLAVAAPAAPASAGNWAVVHLDAEPEGIAAGVPARIGFTVLQHDRTPVQIADVVLDARHDGTAETYRATAAPEGDVGHYVVEAVFPRAGTWAWGITPGPWAATAFPPLTVHDSPTATASPPGRPAAIVAGSCAARGEADYPLADLRATGGPDDADPTLAAPPVAWAGSTGAVPVSVAETTLDVPLPELLAADHALTVDAGLPTELCGDLGGPVLDGVLAVGLRAGARAAEAGVATLRDDAGRTLVTVYVVPVAPTTLA